MQVSPGRHEQALSLKHRRQRGYHEFLRGWSSKGQAGEMIRGRGRGGQVLKHLFVLTPITKDETSFTAVNSSSSLRPTGLGTRLPLQATKTAREEYEHYCSPLLRRTQT